VKFKNSFLDKIQECVKNNNYSDTSHFIRESCQLMMDFIDKQKYFKDNPKEALDYLNEQGLKLENKKMNEAVLEIYKNLEEEDKEKYFLGFALERKTRSENKLQNAKNKRMVMMRGGEFEPKVGYTKVETDGFVWFRPITPDDDNQYRRYWSELTLENKQTLLAELRMKLSELKSIEAKIIESNAIDSAWSRTFTSL
jgi:Arc/MetJ-type ribon-helix-helix transcriptional regulator